MGKLIQTVLCLSLIQAFVCAESCLAAPSIEPVVFHELPWNDINEELTKSSIGSSFSTSDFIPTRMNSSSNFQEVSEKIMMHTFKSYMKSDVYHSSSFGRQTQFIHSYISPEFHILGFGGGRQPSSIDDSTNSDIDETHHDVALKLDAPSSRASLRYTGLLDLNATYSFNETTELDISIDTDLDESTQLRIVHYTRTAESVVSIDYAW